MMEHLCSPAIIVFLTLVFILCLSGWYGVRVSRSGRALERAVAQDDMGPFRLATQRYGKLLRRDGVLACFVLEKLIRYNRVEWLPLLLQYQSPDKLQTYRLEHMEPSLLSSVVTDGTPEMLEALLVEGFDLGRDAESLWMLCCKNCCVAHARVLEAHGADTLSELHREVFLTCGESIYPLHAVVLGAMSRPQAALEMARYLVCEHGEDVNALVAEGHTVLDLLDDELFCRNDRVAPLRAFLLTHGAVHAEDLTEVQQRAKS